MEWRYAEEGAQTPVAVRVTLITALRLARVRDPLAVARGAGGILYRWARRRGMLVALLLASVATGVLFGLLWTP